MEVEPTVAEEPAARASRKRTRSEKAEADGQDDGDAAEYGGGAEAVLSALDAVKDADPTVRAASATELPQRPRPPPPPPPR